MNLEKFKNNQYLVMNSTTGYDDGGGAEGDKKPDDAKPEDKVTDDFGYDVDDKKPDDAKPEDKKPEEKKEAEPDLKDSKTGYGEEPPAVEDDKKPEDKKEGEDDKPSEDDSKEGEVTIKDKGKLTDDEAKGITEFAKKHKLPQAVVDEMVEQKKAEIEHYAKIAEDQEAERAKAIAKQKADWHRELKEDPTFGGDNFKTNVAKVDKLLEENLPNIKKKLTDSNAMLPPYIMRDLASLANVLHKTESLVNGDKGGGSDEDSKDNKSDDPLAFYE